MNHTSTAFLSAALSLVGIPRCFNRAADSDLAWLIRTHYLHMAPPAAELETRRRETRENTANYRRNLQRKTIYSLIWVALAASLALLLVVVPSLRPPGSLSNQQIYTSASVIAFAWGTLGRLGWNEGSIRGATVFEELDAIIFWLLYGLGTFCGVAAVAARSAA